MPNVNGKKFPYTAKGKKDAAEEFDKIVRRSGRLEDFPAKKRMTKITEAELAKGKKPDAINKHPENRPGSADKARKFFARREALKKMSKGKMK